MFPFLIGLRFDVDVVWEFLFDPLILRAAWMTLRVAVIAQVLGIGLGVIFALLRMSRNPFLGGFANFYIWFIRGTPVLLQLFLVQFGLPGFLGNDPDISQQFTFFRVAIFTFAVNEGAYMAEIVRAGILSVESGQMDAAKSLGMTNLQAMRRIVLPQALRVMVPPTGNEFIAMLKNTSIASTIGLVELVKVARRVSADNFAVMEMMVVAAFWYLMMTTVFSILQVELERRLAVGERERPQTLFSRMLAIIGGRRGI
jgi:polar amino acid transport system permease protein